MSKERVVIIGFGWVGQANALALVIDGYEVSYYDIGTPQRHYEKYSELYQKVRRLSTVTQIDGPQTVYVVCVGDQVDKEGNQDISNIKKALLLLKLVSGTVVIRSTILPSYLKELNFDIYLPEFLHEKMAVEECVNPQYILVGKKHQNIKIPSFIEIWRKRSVKQMDCSPEEASYVKYLSNIWNALRIAFVNEFGSSIEEPTSPRAMQHIDTVVNFMFAEEPYMRYGRAFDGHCLPKDSRAYAKWTLDNKQNASILKNMVISNDTHKSLQENNSYLKEWFSNWPEQTGSGWVALHILGQSIKRNLFHPFKAWGRRKTVVYRKNI